VHPSTGALVIESDMAGVLAADLAVTADPVARTLTVRGVKLPVHRPQQQRRQSSIDFGFFGLPVPMPVQPVEPHGFFTRVISLAELDPHSVLDLESMRATMDAQNNKLEVTIPRHAAPVRRAAPSAPAPQQQQQRHQQQMPYGYSTRQPTRHADYYSNDSGEEEEADASNLFFQQRPQPQRQPQPRMQYQRPSPFFGSNGWW
jgi:hypothetical protein